MAYTSQTRLLGLNSGIDTEGMVTQLMNAESMKLNSLYRNTQMLTWKQEAYRGVYTSLQTFQNTFLSYTSMATNMRSTAMYKSFTSTVQTRAGVDFKGIKVTAGDKAKAGTYKVKVSQLAQKDVYKSINPVGGKIEGMDLDALKETGGSINITLDGKTKTINIDKNDFDSDVNVTLKNINDKLAAAFGTEAFGKGEKNTPVNKVEFTLVGVKDGKNVYNLTTTQGHTVSISDTAAKTSATANSKLSPDSIENATFTVEFNNKTYTFNNNGKATTENALMTDINKWLKETTGLSDAKMTASISDSKITFATTNTKDVIDISNAASLGFGADAVKLNQSPTLEKLGVKPGASSELDMSKTLYELFGYTTNLVFKINGKTIDLVSATKLSDLVDKVNSSDAGVKLTYDKSSQGFTLESTSTGQSNAIQFDDDALDFFSKDLKLFDLNNDGTIKDTRGDELKAQDAIYTYNGVTTSRESNTITIEDGISLTLSDVTVTKADKPEDPDNYVTITIGQDTNKSMENIKKFVEAYNALIDGINGQVNTSRPKYGKYTYYDPLLDEEKAEMSEKQIETWEEKAKTGILYRDSILSGITSELRSMLYQSVSLGGDKKISLYEIGITTSSKTSEGGKLVIDEDKLRKALEERPDDVAELFTKSSTSTDKNLRMKEEGLMERVNDIMDKYVKTSTSPIATKAGIKGTWTETNNSLYKELTNMNNRIDDMLTKLAKKEEYYYNMFAKMESAMAQSNSQANYLAQAFGS